MRYLRAAVCIAIGYAIGLKRGYWHGWNDGKGFE